MPLLGLAAAGLMIAHVANSPSEGVIKAAAVPQAPKRTAPTFTPVRGKTAGFEVSNLLHQAKADALSAGDVEKFSFVNPAVPPWNLDIQVRKLPSGLLTDDASYNLRLHHPEQYIEQKLTINSAPASIMSDKTAGFGKVGFLTHGGLVAEIALTSTSTSDNNQLQATLMKVLQTWQWL